MQLDLLFSKHTFSAFEILLRFNLAELKDCNIPFAFQYLLSSNPKRTFGSDHLIEGDPQGEVVHSVVILFIFYQLRGHETWW